MAKTQTQTKENTEATFEARYSIADILQAGGEAFGVPQTVLHAALMSGGKDSYTELEVKKLIKDYTERKVTE